MTEPTLETASPMTQSVDPPNEVDPTLDQGGGEFPIFALVCIVIGLLLFAVAVIIMQSYYDDPAVLEEQTAQQKIAEITALQESLAQDQRVDGRLQALSIDKAMRLIVEERRVSAPPNDEETGNGVPDEPNNVETGDEIPDEPNDVAVEMPDGPDAFNDATSDRSDPNKPQDRLAP